jgi:2-phosphoglycerate kinase
MRRLRRFQDLYELDLPIILLVGGATGTGKSTVATDVAYRLARFHARRALPHPFRG